MDSGEIHALREELVTAAGMLFQEVEPGQYAKPMLPFIAGALGRLMIRINAVHRPLQKMVGSHSVTNDDFDRSGPRAALLEALLADTKVRSKMKERPADDALVNEVGTLRAQLTKARDALAVINVRAAAALDETLPPSKQSVKAVESRRRRAPTVVTTTFKEPIVVTLPGVGYDATVTASGLKGAAVKMLKVAATFYPGLMTKAQIARAAKMKVTGGAFGAHWRALTKGGFLEEREPDQWIATKVGLAFLGADRPEVPRDMPGRIDFWNARLKPPEQAMLAEIVRSGMRGLTKSELAQAVNMEERGGAFGAYLRTLKVNKLVDDDGAHLVVHRWLKDGAA